MKEIKVGFCGARRAVSFRHFQEFPGFKNFALMDPNPEILKNSSRKMGIEGKNCLTSFEELLDCGIDVLVVASPMQFHAPQSIAALKRGIHTLSEVTAATTLKECRELLKAAKESKAFYMMAENYVFSKENCLVKALVEKGFFGELYYAEGEYIHDVKDLLQDEKGNPTWRSKLQTGKNGITYGTHSLGPVLTWMNERVKFITCLGSGVHTRKENKLEDSVVMLGKTEKDKLVRIRVDLVSNRPHCMNYYSLQGTKGCYGAPRGFGDSPKIWLADFHKETHRVWHSLGEFEKEFLPEPWKSLESRAKEAGHSGGDFMEIYHFVECIRNNIEPEINIYKALDWTLPGILSEKSIENGGIPIEVPDPRIGF